MGLTHTLGSYGECSGNPDRENTKAYTLVVLDNLLASTAPKKILLIAGAIANFTHIDKTFLGIIDALEEKLSRLKEQDFQILVRRG
jgi:succinyl-CoA synthetase beta subunit